MKLLCLGRAYRRDGQEVALRVIPEGTRSGVQMRSSDFMGAPSRQSEVLLFSDEGESKGMIKKIAEAAGATFVPASYGQVISTLRKEGTIPEGWPRPLW